MKTRKILLIIGGLLLLALMIILLVIYSRPLHPMNEANEKSKNLEYIDSYEKEEVEKYKNAAPKEKDNILKRTIEFQRDFYLKNLTARQRDEINYPYKRIPYFEKLKKFFEADFWKYDPQVIFKFTDVNFRTKEKIEVYRNQLQDVHILACKRFDDDCYGFLIGVNDAESLCVLNVLCKSDKNSINLYPIFNHSWSSKLDLYNDQSPYAQLELIKYKTLSELIMSDNDYFLSPGFKMNNSLLEVPAIKLPI